MIPLSTRTTPWLLLAVLIPAAGLAADASGRASGSYLLPSRGRPLTMAEASWTYRPPEEPRVLKLYDLVKVRVNERIESRSEGEMDRRKKADGTFVLKDWISLAGMSLSPDAQGGGDPSITGEMQSKYRAESEMETRNSMSWVIQCRVVDIRPNGNVVLEGRKSIRNNNDTWELWLFGTIQPEDVPPNNMVSSEDVDHIQIIKRESGHVRDGYRRGWFSRWLDKMHPF
ncbi:MAG: flagellar basal body L-ring protein FlgH [Planctomycetota bacterium]|jgi:flagellar L-ring protein precursor FlgH